MYVNRKNKAHRTSTETKSKFVSGEDVLIRGFGKFCVKEKRERRGRNPAARDSYDAGGQEVGGVKMFEQVEG